VRVGPAKELQGGAGGGGVNERTWRKGDEKSRCHFRDLHPQGDGALRNRLQRHLAGDATGSVSINGSADATLTVTVADDSHTHNTIYYTETEVNNAKLYQYGNTGGVANAEGTSGAVLGATRVTPRIYVQTTNPGTTGVVGDIWFEI
jgi:hypothetical protein